MKDTDIIKALEYCADFKTICKECSIKELGCMYFLAEESLDLINRQKAEIEKWRNECENTSVLWKKHYESIFESAKETIRAEAIKEFRGRLWKKLCTRVTPSFVFDFIRFVEEEMEKEMKEEMVGEKE